MLNNIVKKILQIFFYHPVGGLIVKDDEGKFIGILQKEKIMDLLNYNISDEQESFDLLIKSFLPITSANIEKFYSQVDPIPVITLQGTLTGFVKKEELLKKPDPVRTPQLPPSEKEPEKTSDPLQVLNYIGLPILVVNRLKTIDFANQAFLSQFGFEPKFILTQNLSSFFPKLKLEENKEGSLTYSHKPWRYKVQFNIDAFFIVFWLQKTRQNYDYNNEIKKLEKGTDTLDTLVKNYENKIIAKISKKTKGNTKSMANWLGIKEEILTIKMSRKQK